MARRGLLGCSLAARLRGLRTSSITVIHCISERTVTTFIHGRRRLAAATPRMSHDDADPPSHRRQILIGLCLVPLVELLDTVSSGTAPVIPRFTRILVLLLNRMPPTINSQSHSDQLDQFCIPSWILVFSILYQPYHIPNSLSQHAMSASYCHHHVMEFYINRPTIPVHSPEPWPHVRFLTSCHMLSPIILPRHVDFLHQNCCLPWSSSYINHRKFVIDFGHRPMTDP